MRRILASLVLGLALLAAGISWAAFTTRSTVFDPARSERIAEVLVDSPVVQDAAAAALSRALQEALPAGTLASSAQVDELARAALADPRAIEAIKTAIVGAHRRMMGDGDNAGGGVVLDAGPIAQAGRDALIAARPDLATVLPQPPDLQMELPTERLPEMGRLREPLRLAVGLGAVAAMLLLAVAFLLASDRPKVLSRMGRWALGAGLWWAIVGYGVPRLLSNFSDDRLAVLGALGTAVSGPLVAPALALALTGAGVMVGSHLWKRSLATPASAPMPETRPVFSAPAAPVSAGEAQLDRGWDRRRPVYRRPQSELDAATRHYTGMGGGTSPYPQDGPTGQRNGDTPGGASTGRHVAHHRGADR
jgi:hypothetical protein